MSNLNIFASRLNKLIKVGGKDDGVFLKDVRKEYRQDLLNFIAGETLSSREGQLLIGQNLYQRWLKKVIKKGFDYDIRLKK